MNALARAPWWFLIPISLMIGLLLWFCMIIPAVSTRQWAVPQRDRLLHLEARIAMRDPAASGPYRVTDSRGNRIFLFCHPYVAKYNGCLNDYATKAHPLNEEVSLSYFNAKDIYGLKKVVMEASTKNEAIMKYSDSANSLNGLAKVEDENGGERLFMLIFASGMMIWLSGSIIYKVFGFDEPIR
ncbi:MAG: hypothetical protein ACYDD1_20820 [Caulobacteraceae bacterium]